MIRILLADDHQLMLEGISSLLENEKGLTISATCSNGLEVLETLKKQTVEVVLLDLSMPKMNGLACAKEIKQQYPNIKIAILTMHKEKALIQQIIDLGVQGYFVKTIANKELIKAVTTIANGERYFPEEVKQSLISKKPIFTPDVTVSPLVKTLTKRELEIIKLISKGLATKEIADQLFISVRTADTHRTNIMRKLEVRNVAELVRFAFQNKINV